MAGLIATASSSFVGQRVVSARPVASSSASRGSVTVRAGLFGWAKNNKDPEGREVMWEEQQRILRERKTGRRGMPDATLKRRQAVSRRMADERAGKIKKTPIKKPLYKKEDEDVRTGIIIPIAPFGIPEMDGGERFDLRLPYVDKGYEDPDADVMGKFMNMFKGKKDKAQEGKGGKKGRK